MYPNSDSSFGNRSRALIVGAGALGCAAARTLAQGRSVAITLVDDDLVELSNLQRQVLYEDADIGRLKVEAAADHLERELDSRIEPIPCSLDADNGAELVENADVVIDATDDPQAKFLLNRLCVEASTPYVYAGVARTGGQWMLVDPGNSACLECVFPASSRAQPGASGAEETAAGCSALGILAPVAGFVGSMQAIAAMTQLQRPERAKPGRLHLYELTGARARHIDFAPAAGCFCAAARDTRNFPGEIAP